MRVNIGGYILLILIVLMVFGVISFGDVLSVVFYIFMGIVLLVLIGVLLFGHRLNRLRREAQRQEAGGGSYGRYGRGDGSRSRYARRPEGEVTVEGTEISRTKVVSSDIGSYVEYEEIKEEKTES